MTEINAEPPRVSILPQIWLSLFLHVVIVIVAILRVVVFSKPVIYTDAIRVDIVGMPEKVTSPAPVKTNTPIAPEKIKTETKPKVAEPPKVNLNPKPPSKKAENDAIERIRGLEKIEQETQSESAQDKSETFKGNVISPGTTLTGIDELQHDAYVSQLDAYVKKNWVLPQWLSQANLHAQVLVKIDRHGNVLSHQIVLSSGNSVFDQYAIEAIDKSNPFPKPPDKFVDILKVSGVEFGFPQ